MFDPVYSFVLPVFNERACLPALLGRLRALLDQLDGAAELVFVDDGSRDGSDELILLARRDDPRIKLIRFSRNFGHQIAITAGIERARGRAVIVMDSDLQDPPELALQLIAEWKQGYEVVYAVRHDRLRESWLKKATADGFYRVLAACSDVLIPRDAGDFRLLDRRVVEAFKAMPERHRFVRGMLAWVGFRQKGVPFVRQGRLAGASKYGPRAMVKLATTALIAFSKTMLRLPFYLSCALAVTAALALGSGVVGALSGIEALVLSAVLGVGALQSAVLGVFGLYLGQLHDEAKGRPLYLIDTSYGLDDRPEAMSMRARLVKAA
jgi:glycosyltransferase involved in cell wall biosynthesis